MNRRVAIREMGKAGLALVVFGTAACTEPGGTGSTTTAAITGTTAAPPGAGTTTPSPGSTSGPASSTTGAPATAFLRVNLDFVSAYVLYRGGEAALVDTGVEGSADSIGAALGEAGLDWGAVGHVILTHKHPDHVGGLDAVLERAAGAALYAGAGDIPSIDAAPSPVGDGDSVFGLDIIETPGHTPGHVAVLDPAAGILVAGDALNGAGGSVGGPNPDFSEDMGLAIESVGKLAGFGYEVALFGHGEPVLQGASAAVADLAGTLG